jgi:pyruvate dehydrogenase E1 component alpha subunit
VGLGYAIKYRKEDSVVFAFVGDGGTSQGDFHEALNFAAVWKVPVIFIIQNNQYAISVPVKKQTASKNLAIKAVAYGMPGIKVDGNDFFALYKTIEESLRHVKAGKGPVLVEALTYRRGAHTTSDDPTLYRTDTEEKEWEAKDPIKRLRGYLAARGAWKEKDEEPLLEQYKKEVEKEFAVSEKHPDYPVDDVFQYQFNDMPEDLRQQQAAYEKFLQWQEAQK